MKTGASGPAQAGPVKIGGKQFLGARDAKKVAALFSEIAGKEKEAAKFLSGVAKKYYDAGGILARAAAEWRHRGGRLTAKAVADAGGFPERGVALALKIFRSFEGSPGRLDGLSLRDALKLVAPPPPAGEDGYNRIDLGGDPGQLKLGFDELFEVPAAANRSLQSYRTVGDLVTDIIVVHKGKDNLLTSKRFAHFCEDIPQNPLLRAAYKAMSQKTQAAIEDYLAALEQEEDQK